MAENAILIPGFLDTAGLFRRMAATLGRAGIRSEVFPLSPSTGARGMDEMAEDLAGFVERRLGRSRTFGLVGFSMGGIVARYYVQRLGGAARVRPLITISTPHRGTATAWLLPIRGIRQIRPGSAFLEDLNRDTATLEEVGFASIWSPIDPMIVPPSSSALGVGAETRLLIPVHAWLPRSRRVIGRVVELLRS